MSSSDTMVPKFKHAVRANLMYLFVQVDNFLPTLTQKYTKSSAVIKALNPKLFYQTNQYYYTGMYILCKKLAVAFILANDNFLWGNPPIYQHNQPSTLLLVANGIPYHQLCQNKIKL